MGRRRRHSSKNGLVEEVLDLVLELAKASPLAGFVLGVGFCGGGAYLMWGNPKLMWGIAPLFGILLILLGVMCLGIGAMGALKRALDGGQRALGAATASRPMWAPPSSTPAHRPRGVWDLDAVREMSWQQFERLIADLFRRMGYAVEERGRDAARAGTGDGGVDLVLTSANAPGASFLVQCKQYRAWDVGEPKVREFFGAMAAWRSRCEGIIITCGEYSQPARAFVADKPIKLIDGDGLLRLLNQNNPITPQAVVAAPAPVQAVSVQPISATTTATTPTCPSCGVAMLRRTATRGRRRGQPFWGCPNYPSCTVCINISC